MDCVAGVRTVPLLLTAAEPSSHVSRVVCSLSVVIIYVYTILGFNFYRKFFVVEDDDPPEAVCESMYQCFLFTLDSGVRNGGGIGDALPRQLWDP